MREKSKFDDVNAAQALTDWRFTCNECNEL